MPHYEFYSVPENACRMSFEELFIDCFRQGEEAGWELAPLLFEAGQRGKTTPTVNIPVPDCLGDMVKLFLGVKPIMNSAGEFKDAQGVEVERVSPVMDAEKSLEYIQECRRISTGPREARGELVLALETWQDDSDSPRRRPWFQLPMRPRPW